MKNPEQIYPVWPFGLVLALCTSVLAGDVWAQAATSSRFLCSSLGAGSGEAVGDRAGHSIQAARASCRVEGGPLDGGLAAVSAIWEFDGATGTLLSGDGVVRKDGAMAAFRTTAGSVALTMKDGAVSGWTASGKGVFTMASGTAAALAGKTYSYTARRVGTGQNVQEFVLD